MRIWWRTIASTLFTHLLRLLHVAWRSNLSALTKRQSTVRRNKTFIPLGTGLRTFSKLSPPGFLSKRISRELPVNSGKLFKAGCELNIFGCLSLINQRENIPKEICSAHDKSNVENETIQQLNDNQSFNLTLTFPECNFSSTILTFQITAKL